MKSIPSSLEGICILEPKVFGDHRGFFIELHHQNRYRKFAGDRVFVQDNLSFSAKKTLRGLHYQLPHPQAKLIQVITGEIFDVAVDIRRNSPTFGKWIGVHLSDTSHRQLFIPEGFAHGFCVLSDAAHVLYKCTDYYHPDTERGIVWSDPDIGIDWPVTDPILSDRDRVFPRLGDIPSEHLFLSEPSP